MAFVTELATATEMTSPVDVPQLALPNQPVEVTPPLTRIERRRAARRSRGTAVAAWIIGLATLVLRLATAATGPTDWDSAQYASAVNHFDVTHGQPQPPGYWFYVMAGRLIHHVFGLGTIHSLVLIAALASGCAAGLTTVAGTDLGGRWVGLAAGLIVATCPFAWFSGSIVATYSFDMVGCSLLVILAWRARPQSWHGVGAVVALGLLAGFRPSMIQSFAILALIPVVASTRRIGRLFLTVVSGAAAVAIWLVPMSLSQAGGFSAWLRATRTEATGAAQSTSVFDHAAGASTNLGTFAAYTVLALGPLVVVALAAGAAIGIRSLINRNDRTEPGPSLGERPLGRVRPWYQSRTAILLAAVVPPMALVALLQFAKGGYLLAYLPAAVIALLLPLGALNRRVFGRPGSSPGWVVVTSIAVIAIVALGTQRFLSGDGVLPEQYLRPSGAIWIEQPRYQAPYTDTRQTIRGTDAVDSALNDLGPSVNSARDVVLFDTIDGGANIYRNAGWELPNDRIALAQPGKVIYNQLHGALYYASSTTVAVRPAGSVFLIAAPTLPGLASLIVQGSAIPVATPQPIGAYKVWRILPGTSFLGLRVVSSTAPRPLGTGI
jgi:hypothetical protein